MFPRTHENTALLNDKSNEYVFYLNLSTYFRLEDRRLAIHIA